MFFAKGKEMLSVSEALEYMAFSILTWPKCKKIKHNASSKMQ
ncbi:MAG: hypothetical protein UH678_03165 [Fibrobacteraceae bacterium]|nr:hypothetical protein [Fibrobacteraceae bacterium]